MSEKPTAFVTGSLRRVGLVVAERLASEGYGLVLHGNTSGPEVEEAAVEQVKEAGGSAPLVLRGDLSRPEDCEALALKIHDLFPSLDLLVNNASTFHATPPESLTAARIEDALAVHTLAPFRLTWGLRDLLLAAEGSVVNLVDGSALKPWRDYLAHGLSKAGLLYLTRALARLLAPEVRVNAVLPGPVLFPESYDREKRERILSNTPLGMGSPDDVARAVLYLARDARFTTGDCLHVDGGLH
jgi:pteridine reductase